MAKNLGWVKLHRTLAYNKLWISEPFTKGQAWVDLLMLAGRDGKLEVTYRFLTERWKWYPSKTFRFLQQLEAEGMIEFCGTENGTENGTGNGTAFCLINWEKFQHRGTRNGTESGTENGTLSENLLIRRNNKKDITRSIKQEPYMPHRKKNRVVNGYEQHDDIGDVSWMEEDFSKEN